MTGNKNAHLLWPTTAWYTVEMSKLGRKIRRNHNYIVNLSTIRKSIHVHKRKGLKVYPLIVFNLPRLTSRVVITGRLAVKCMFEQTHAFRECHVKNEQVIFEHVYLACLRVYTSFLGIFFFLYWIPPKLSSNLLTASSLIFVFWKQLQFSALFIIIIIIIIILFYRFCVEKIIE